MHCDILNQQLHNWKAYVDRDYSMIASRYYAFKNRKRPIPPPISYQVSGKSDYTESYIPNACTMGISNGMRIYIE